MADDKAPQSNTDKRGGNERRWVTMIVLIGSFGGLIVLATLIIISSWIQKPSDDAKKLFDALLPVFGTWVGTLLAFYFSKDNFEAATKSVTEMANKISGADEKLKAIPVRDKMRSATKITSWPIKPGEEDKAKLSDILKKCADVDRIPMLNDKGAIVYLVYKNLLYKFLSQAALDTSKLKGKTLADLTFKDVLDSDPTISPTPKEIFQKSFGLVPENATLADAKRKMEELSKSLPCNDIFVTQSGKSDEPILGWITDNKIAENSKVESK